MEYYSWKCVFISSALHELRLKKVNITSYTEVFAPIPEDIHRVLKSLYSPRALAQGEYKYFSMRWISLVLVQKTLCDDFIIYANNYF